MAAFNFNAHSVEPTEARDNAPLPAGAYTVEVTGAELRDLKSGNGQGLSVDYTVIDPEPFARRKVWSNLNITHSNPTAEQIGRQQLAALCLACGIDNLNDTDEFFGKIIRIQTRIRPATEKYPKETAEVSGWMPAGTGTTPAAVVKAPTPTKPTASAAKPWARAA